MVLGVFGYGVRYKKGLEQAPEGSSKGLLDLVEREIKISFQRVKVSSLCFEIM